VSETRAGLIRFDATAAEREDDYPGFRHGSLVAKAYWKASGHFSAHGPAGRVFVEGL
jgi:hypothetical protein